MASFSALLPSNSDGIEPTQHKIKTSDKFGRICCGDRERHMLMDFPPAIAATAIASLGAGAAVLAEVGTANVAAFFMDASTDSHGFMKVLPWNIDVAQDIHIAVYWNQSQGVGTGS